MFIQTERTPNPATLKFLPGRDVLGSGAVDCPDRAAADRSPLATRLFDVEGVKSVFLGADFVSVTKEEAADWFALKPRILGALMDHLTSGAPVVEAGVTADDATDDDPVTAKIKHLLDTRVRPAVARDGGDITFHRFEGGVVHLTMRGACSGCPSATATLKRGIETLLRHHIPEVSEVRAVR